MDDIRSGKVKAAFFLFFIVVLIVGGYFGVVFLTKNENKELEKEEVATKNEEALDIRIDKNKDYIYYDNIVEKNKERDIIYQDVVFNFDTNDAKNIAIYLNSKKDEYEASYKLISEVELTDEEKEKVLYKESDVYSATFSKYTRYFYKNYASIIDNVYEYNCLTGQELTLSKAYVFDTNTGALLSKSKLLEIYNLSLDDIKEVIKEKLEKEQKVVDEVPEIDITATLNSLDDDSNYALYVNKTGYLVISYFIKNIQKDYNDVIILD